MKSEAGLYWFTTSIVEMQNVFVTKKYFKIIIESFRYFEIERNVRTVLYCVMPNHLHWSFKLPNDADNPIDVYRDFKRHTAREILNNLKYELNHGLYETIDLFKGKKVCSRCLPDDLLRIFEYHAINKNQNYAVWQEDPDLKLINTEKFFIEKANYCHKNPTQPKWQFVDDPKDYPYSSSRLYEGGGDWNGLDVLNPLI